MASAKLKPRGSQEHRDVRIDWKSGGPTRSETDMVGGNARQTACTPYGSFSQ